MGPIWFNGPIGLHPPYTRFQWRSWPRASRGIEPFRLFPPDAIRFAEVEAARVPLDEALVAVSRDGEPAALRIFATGEVALAPDRFAPVFGDVFDRLDAKAAHVTAAAQAAAAVPADAASARHIVATLVAALQDALDGEALPVLPVIRKRAETTAETDFSSGTAVAGSLAEWAPLRARIRNVRAFLTTLGQWRAYEVTEAATTTGDPDGDTRPETEAPRPRYYGTFLADRTFIPGAELYAGLVIDEWAEQRPSRSQTTGVAINYNSPQSEAPNCLLLCEPATGDQTTWSELDATRMVAETISWMKNSRAPVAAATVAGGTIAADQSGALQAGRRRWHTPGSGSATDPPARKHWSR